MKTLLVTIGIVVAGIAYAGDLDPPMGPVAPTMHTLDEIYTAVTNPPCCSPRPEDIRRYFVHCPSNCESAFVVIPKVEGTNGFVITDIVAYNITSVRFRLFEDGAQLLQVNVGPSPSHAFKPNFTSGLPVSPGSTITADATSNSNTWVTVMGYVY